jgi:AcrR family transcriptional regulator
MTRLTRVDWFKVGVLLLLETGSQGLTVDALLTRVKVTKGSFYHHFKNIADFEQALIAHIEQAGTLQIIEQVDALTGTAQERLRRLIEIVTSYQPELEVAIRTWSHSHPSARQMQERVDARRVEFMVGLLREMGYAEDQALRLARILYAILIGSEHMQPPVHGEALRALFDEFLKSYGL